MRVAILPTGRMEWQALPTALQRLFPAHEFYAIPTLREIETQQSLPFPLDSFTSCDVNTLFERTNNADKLIERAAAEALGDRHKDAADLVLILDDLELVNRAQPQAVVTVVRQAVNRFLDRHASIVARQARFRDVLRNRVSFHLACPMIESWIFADPLGPFHAGVSPDRPVRLVPGRDPEWFVTDDPDYISAQTEECECYRRLPEAGQRKHRPAWMRAGEQRVSHAKAYLCWLCLDSTQKNCTAYEETKGGAKALTALNWNALLNRPVGEVRFLRALLADLADGLCDPLRDLLACQELVPATSPFDLPPDPLLRNL